MTPPTTTAAGSRTRSRPERRTGFTHRAPVAPRRVSGPLPARPTRERLVPLRERLAEFIRTLPDHSLLDRIVRGRTWIALLGVMLAGIVAMQVELLKLNASIGRSIELGVALQSRNDNLRASVSSLSDPQRIERLATGMGMVMAGPTSVQFLDARHVSPAQAAANIHAADPASFQAALQAMLSSATQNSSAQGATTGSPAAAPQATASTSATATAAGPTPTPAASAVAPTSPVAPTGPATPTTPGTPNGAAAAPIGRPVTPAGGGPAPTAGAVAPTGAAAGTSGGQSIRGSG